MNVAKPRPDDHPLIIFFVVGGITWFEVQKIQASIVELKPESKVFQSNIFILMTLAEVLISLGYEFKNFYNFMEFKNFYEFMKLSMFKVYK